MLVHGPKWTVCLLVVVMVLLVFPDSTLHSPTKSKPRENRRRRTSTTRDRELLELHRSNSTRTSTRNATVSATVKPMNAGGPPPKLACVSNPCKNQGTCKEVPNRADKQHICHCPPGFDPSTDCFLKCPRGFFGKNCLLECLHCDMRQCHHRTGCSVCVSGFTNTPRCDMLNCRSGRNPCLNDGNCQPGWNKCKCPRQFTGLLCETRKAVNRAFVRACNDRLNLNCANGGWCYIAPNDFNIDEAYCECVGKFTGITCRETCLSKSYTCVNGRCAWLDEDRDDDPDDLENRRIDPGGLYCQCDDGWKGETCEKKCPYNYWGEDCKRVCGHCQNLQTLCEPISGHCDKKGCQPDWGGAWCTEWIGLGPRRVESIEVRGQMVYELRPNSTDYNPWDQLDNIKDATIDAVLDLVSEALYKRNFDRKRLKMSAAAERYIKNPLSHVKRQAEGSSAKLGKIEGVATYFTITFPPETSRSRDLGKLVSNVINSNTEYFEERLPNLKVNPKLTKAIQVQVADETSATNDDSSAPTPMWPMLLTVGLMIAAILVIVVGMMFTWRRSHTRRQAPTLGLHSRNVRANAAERTISAFPKERTPKYQYYKR